MGQDKAPRSNQSCFVSAAVSVPLTAFRVISKKCSDRGAGAAGKTENEKETGGVGRRSPLRLGPVLAGAGPGLFLFEDEFVGKVGAADGREVAHLFGFELNGRQGRPQEARPCGLSRRVGAAGRSFGVGAGRQQRQRYAHPQQANDQAHSRILLLHKKVLLT